MQPWLAPLGKLVLNFSAIELQSYFWLGDLVPSDELVQKYVNARFKVRVDTILSLLPQQSMDEATKLDGVRLWGSTLELAKRRNSILHNPLIYGWSGTDESGPPDYMSIADISHLGAKIPSTPPTITIPGINDLVNETSAVAGALFELRSRWHDQERSDHDVA